MGCAPSTGRESYARAGIDRARCGVRTRHARISAMAWSPSEEETRMARPKFLASLAFVAAAVGSSACAVDAPLDAPSESLGAQLVSTRMPTPRVLSNVAHSTV